MASWGSSLRITRSSRREHYPRIDDEKSLRREYSYICGSRLRIWDTGLHFKPQEGMEGWFITFLCGPLLSIMIEVPKTLLLMTEKRTRQMREVL
ncbi:hypothetical protein BGZ65_002700 [Modicella reniformis]|uniref:Uncharacterized protein n=1 Tax=Modicella reniformis TaxID=1440133 RepID=A0A9P6MLB5_9FUNG|nr:hypothetical protein BGZ65_002700 [Modicella reniformis]